MGLPKVKTFYKITMPMMAAGLVAGAILSWVTMISELSTAILLYVGRTKTLTVEIYTQIIRGNYGISCGFINDSCGTDRNIPAYFQQDIRNQ